MLRALKHNLTVSILIASLMLMVFSVAHAAAPPNIISYQGRVLNTNGVPVSDASLSMKFFLYDSDAGGTCVWSNDSADCYSNTPASVVARSVSLTSGLFTENLGDTGNSYAAIADSVFGDNTSIYLEIEIAGETLSPRRRLTSAPYALNAQRLDGVDSTGFLAATGDTGTGDFDFTGAEFAGASPIVFEGGSNDGTTTTFAITDPTSNRTITFKDASGTVAFLSDVTGEWETGSGRLFEDDYPVVVGTNGAFSYASGAVGDLRIGDELETVGDGFIGADLVVGASTSSTETLDHASFTLGGDDLFVAGDAGVEGVVYSDGGLIVGSGTTFGNGLITTTGTTDLLLTIAGGDLTFGQSTVVGGGANVLSINSSDWDVSTTGDLTGIGGITMDGSFSQTGTGTFSTGTGVVSLNGAVTAGSDMTVTSGARVGTGSTPDAFTALADDSLFVEGQLEVDGAARFDDTVTVSDLTCADCLDFDSFGDSLTLDDATSIATAGFALSTSGTGALSFNSTGQVTFAGNVDATNGLDVTNANLTVGGANFSVAQATGNVTTGGDIAVNGGDITTTATTWNFDVGNTGSVLFRDGTNTLMTIADNGTTGNISSTGDLTSGADLTVTSGARVGTGSTPDAFTALADDSLFVEGQLEVDGAARFDGAGDFNSTLAIGGDISFDASTPNIAIADGETLTVTDGTNQLLGIADAGTVGTLTVSGDLFVEGDNIDSNGAPLVLNATAADEVRVGTGTPGVATGAGDFYTTSDIEADGNLDVAGTATLGDITCTDCLDFDSFGDSMTLDASTQINIPASQALYIDVGASGGSVFRVRDSLENSVFTIDENGESTFVDDVTISLAGSENVLISHDFEGTINIATITGIPTTTAGTANGLYIEQQTSTNTEGLDTAIVIDNADNDLAITNGLQVTSTGGGAITTALNVSASAIGTALSAGENDLSGTNWSISGSTGNIVTSGDVAVNGGDITSTGNLRVDPASGSQLLLGNTTSGATSVTVGNSTLDQLFLVTDSGTAFQDIYFTGGITANDETLFALGQDENVRIQNTASTGNPPLLDIDHTTFSSNAGNVAASTIDLVLTDYADDAAVDTRVGLDITVTNNASDAGVDDNIYGLLVTDLLGSAQADGNEYAMYQSGTSWDYGLYTEGLVNHKNTTTGTGVNIDQDGNGTALNIDSESTTATVFNLDGGQTTDGRILSLLGGDFTNDAGFALSIDVDETTETADIMRIRTDFSASDNNVFRIEADGETFSDVGFTAGAFSTNYYDGEVQTTGDLLLDIDGGDLTFDQATNIGDGGDLLTLDSNGTLAVNDSAIAGTGAFAVRSGGGAALTLDSASGIVSTASADDFVVGNAASLTAAFSVDESANKIRIGDASGANGQIEMYSSNGDTGTISYAVGDYYDLGGGGLNVGSFLDFTDHNSTSSSTVINTGVSPSSTLTGNKNDYSGYFSIGSETDRNGNTYNLRALTGFSQFSSNTVGGPNEVSGVYGMARLQSTAQTTPLTYGVFGETQSNTAGGTITDAVGVGGTVVAGAGDVTTGYGGLFENAADGTNRYGISATASGGSNNYSGYFFGSAVHVDDDSTPNSPSVATGAGDLYVASDIEADGNLDVASGTVTANDISCTDCLDFDEFSNNMTLDENTQITSSGTQTFTVINGSSGNTIFNLISTGDFTIQDSGSPAWTFTDQGAIAHSPSAMTGSPSSTGSATAHASHTYTDNATAASGTSAIHLFNGYGSPTLAATNSSVTTTNAATMYIQGAPAAGTNMTITNPLALWVDSGVTRLDGPFISNAAAQMRGDTAFDLAATENVSISNTTATTDVLSLTATAVQNHAQYINFTLSNDGDADDIAGLAVEVTSNATGDADRLRGLWIQDLTNASSPVVESGIEIGANWDYSLYFNESTPTVTIQNGQKLTFTDDDTSAGPNTLMELTDNGTDGQLTINNILSSGADLIATASAGSSSVGYKAAFTAGQGNGAGFSGGQVAITGGAGASTGSGGAGGKVAINSGVPNGDGSAKRNGGDIEIVAAAGLNAGPNGGDGGGITLTAGNSPSAGDGGNIKLTAGTISGAGNEGNVAISSGGSAPSLAGLSNGDVGIAADDEIDIYADNTIDIKRTSGASINLTGSVDIDGSWVTVDLLETAATEAVCHDGSDAGGGGNDVTLYDCSGAPAADYAEQYPVEEGIEYGDIVVPGSDNVVTNDGDTISKLIKSSEPYAGPIVGIVSDNYGDFTSAGYNIAEEDNPMPVALVGRVPVKVTNENGSIEVGDYLTTSSTPGHAMKATKVGRVIGMALADFDGTTGTVMVQVNNSWYMGDIVGTDGESTLVTDNVVVSSQNEATADEQTFDSYGLALRGSAWNGSEAEAVEMMMQNVVDDTDDYRLSITNSSEAEVAYITNEGTMRIAGNMVVGGNIYPSDRGVPQTDKYIYYDGSSGPAGDFMRTNAKGWSTGSYDFAEMFPSTEELSPGDVVMFAGDGEHIRRTTSSTDKALAGIVSTRPGFLAGENVEGSFPIALAGRVPTRVTLENGSIEVGDPLTSSSTSGAAMKATDAGAIIGYALEPYTGNEIDSLILTYVNVGYWGGEQTDSAPGTENVASGFGSVDATNIQTLSMSGGLFMNTHSITGIGRISGMGELWTISSDGTIRTEALVKNVITSYQNKKVETVAVTSPEVIITLSGTAELVNGEAEVRFEKVVPEYNDVINVDAPIRVVATPNGPSSIYVSEKDQNHFVVNSFAGDENVEFDWMVTAYRRGFEPTEVEEEEQEQDQTEETLLPTEEVVEETIEETTEAVSEGGTEELEEQITETIETAEVVEEIEETAVDTTETEEADSQSEQDSADEVIQQEEMVAEDEPASPERPELIEVDSTPSDEGDEQVEMPSVP